MEPETPPKTNGSAEVVFTSDSSGYRAGATILFIILGALAGFAVAFTIMNYGYWRFTPLDDPYLFFGGGLIGALVGAPVGLLVPLRLDTLCVRPDAVILSNPRRTVEIPASEILVFSGPSNMEASYLKAKPCESSVITFWTCSSKHRVSVENRNVYAAMRALFDAYPRSIGLTNDEEQIRPPEAGFHSLSSTEVARMKDVLNWEVFSTYAYGVAGLLCASGSVILASILGVFKKGSISGIFVGFGIVFALGAYFNLTKIGPAARRTRRQFLSAVENVE